MNRPWLWAALAATLAASAWAVFDEQRQDASAAVQRATPGPALALHSGLHGAMLPPADAVVPAPAGATAIEPRLPDRSPPMAARRDPFGGKPWVAAARPPPPAPVPAAQPVEAAVPRPVLPFTFGGRLGTAGGQAVLLHEGPRTHVVAVGEEVGGFRVDGDAGSHLEFTHVASGERLQLPTRP